MRARGGLLFALLWAVGCGTSEPPTATTMSGGSSGSGSGGIRNDAAFAGTGGSAAGGATGKLDAGRVDADAGSAGGTTGVGGITGRGGSTVVASTGGSSGSGGSSTATAAGGALGRGGTTGTLATGGATGTGGRATGGATTSPGTGGKQTGGTTTTPGTGGKATTGSGGLADGGPSDGPKGSGGSSSGGSGTGGASTRDAGDGSDASTRGAGNPYGSCTAGVPARGLPADCSTPTTVVGTGSAASCDFAKLQAAVSKGGIITFDCGPGAVTIPVTAPLLPPITKDTVIDGGNTVTLDGGGAVQILRWNGTDWMKNPYGVTLQHLTVVNGKATPTEAIATRPAPCSQGWNDGEGGAIYLRDGNLTVIDCVFRDNQAAPLGPDTGGGAIYINGSKNGVLVAGSTFTGNAASNAGAVGCLFSRLEVYDSLFENNRALGRDANGVDQAKCSYINNDQYEVGSGGNGGALYSDGNSVDIVLCGNAILGNAAGQNAYGGGLFFTSNDFGGTLAIIDTTMTGNTGGHWTVVAEGSVDDVGTAVGTNAKSITLTRSTLQGVP